MQNLKQSNLALFFTRGMSLEKWDRIGMFEREVALYKMIAPSLNTLYFFTYGSTHDKSFASRLPVNIVIVPKPAFIPTILYSFLLPYIHAKKLRTVAILKTNQMDGSWTAVIAKKLYGGKLIIRCGYEWLQFIERANRSWIKRKIAYYVEKYAYHNANRIVTTSIGSRQFITEHFGIPSSAISIIPNYVNTELFAPQDIPKEKGRVIAVGRLEPQKNLVILIRAMAGLPMKLILVGKGSEREMLEHEAKVHNVEVVFKDSIAQAGIVTELCMSELYILPSIYEGHPKTLLEAMACGLPCIGTNIEGIRDTITDGYDGIICEPTVSSIHDALTRLYTDPTLRERLGTTAQQTIREHYSLEKIFEKESALYTSL